MDPARASGASEALKASLHSSGLLRCLAEAAAAYAAAFTAASSTRAAARCGPADSYLLSPSVVTALLHAHAVIQVSTSCLHPLPLGMAAPTQRSTLCSSISWRFLCMPHCAPHNGLHLVAGLCGACTAAWPR